MRSVYFCLLSLTLLSSNPAYCAEANAPPPSTTVQMLPPVNSGTTNVCSNTGKSKILSWDGVTPLACNNDFSIDETNHNIQIPQASTTSDCDQAHTGSLRWNDSTAKFEGCDGHHWSPLGGASGWVGPPPGWESDGYSTWDPAAGTTTQIYGPNWQTNYTPTSWCKEKGYGAASGACINNGNIQGTLSAVSGSAGSLSSYSTSWFCSSGNGSTSEGTNVSGPLTQILCIP